LILRKISKFYATRCQLLRLKCTQNPISAGAPPQTPLGELTALPRPLLLTGGREKRGRGRGRKKEGKGKWKGKER